MNDYAECEKLTTQGTECAPCTGAGQEQAYIRQEGLQPPSGLSAGRAGTHTCIPPPSPKTRIRTKMHAHVLKNMRTRVCMCANTDVHTCTSIRTCALCSQFEKVLILAGCQTHAHRYTHIHTHAHTWFGPAPSFRAVAAGSIAVAARALKGLTSCVSDTRRTGKALQGVGCAVCGCVCTPRQRLRVQVPARPGLGCRGGVCPDVVISTT